MLLSATFSSQRCTALACSGFASWMAEVIVIDMTSKLSRESITPRMNDSSQSSGILTKNMQMYFITFKNMFFIAGTSCDTDHFSMNSICYKKADTLSVSWYVASNDCLSRGGSLAVFTDIGHPSNSSQLTNWLTNSGTDKTYWIGLVRSWWRTTDEGKQCTA